MTDVCAPTHRSSHLSLLAERRSGDGRVDAIVMPASRPAANLLPAMEVAATLQRRLVVLCSGRTSTKEAAGLAAEVPGLECTLLDLHGGWSHEALRFGTGQVREAMDSRVGDLSTKRNLGLLLARVAGWRGVLFLDDDIRDLSPRMVRKAESVLRPGGAVGMISADFPDNSVVCHALRLSGVWQGVFVSGSALAVDTATVDSFFPDVYNEDWLFLHDRMRRGLVSASSSVRQAPYLPYADPARARREEFGDVLAEGLMNLVHGGTSGKRAMRESYWTQVIEQRHRLLDGILSRLADTDQPDAEAAQDAVRAARSTLQELDGPVFAMYVERWRQDLQDWRKRVELLPHGRSLPEALEELGLRHLDASSAPAPSEDRRRWSLPWVVSAGTGKPAPNGPVSPARSEPTAAALAPVAARSREADAPTRRVRAGVRTRSRRMGTVPPEGPQAGTVPFGPVRHGRTSGLWPVFGLLSSVRPVRLVER